MGRLIFTVCVGVWLASTVSASSVCAEESPAPDTKTEPSTTESKSEEPLHWRRDPSVKRHPGSYIGGGFGYVQSRAWIPGNIEHRELNLGPIHTCGGNFRVGDAFTEWFALGFKVSFNKGSTADQSITSFIVFLDTAFYPWRGLGLRPALGLGFGLGQGENDWDTGFGGPISFALAINYEIRITRLFVIAPVAEITYLTGNDFDGLFLFLGIEVIKWFETATG